MEKKEQFRDITEVIVSTLDKNQSAKISKMVKEGKLRKIAPKIYTPNLEDTAESIVLNAERWRTFRKAEHVQV